MQSTKLPTSVRLVFAYEDQNYISEYIKCTHEASFSCFLTMASFLCQRFPDMAPPSFPEDAKIKDNEQSVQERRQKKLYFQPWCDYFNLLMDHKDKGQIQKLENALYLISYPGKQFYEKQKQLLKNVFKSLSSQQFQELLKKLTKLGPKQKRTRVGIINFAKSQLTADKFTPKVNLLSLFGGIWYDHGDIWKIYDVLKGNYPNQDQIMNTDVFILSGSTLSVNDNNENVAKTMQILESGLKMNKNLRLLGLCFGHQAIAKHFGGEVERKNLYSGIQVIKFDNQIIKNFSFLSKVSALNEKGCLMFQYHNDYVQKLPSDFSVLGYSSSCEVESMISEDGRCLTFQFHSQYTYGYCQDFEMKIKKYFKQDLYKTDHVLQLQALQKYGIERHIQSCKIVREVARQFIDLNKSEFISCL